MGILRTLLFAGLCIGVGIFASSYEIDGRTPLEHIQRAFKNNGQFGKVKDGMGDALDGAKDKLTEAKQSAKDKLAVATAPKEHISSDDRSALNALIAKKQK